MTDRPPQEALRALVEQWREMARCAFESGPIPGDEIGHVSRWTAVEMCADELDAALTGFPERI